MRSRTCTKRAVLFCSWILPALAMGGVLAGGPVDDASARACLQMESQPAAPGTAGCTKFFDLRNTCDLDVLVEVRRTQHLFSGTLRQTFSVVVPAGGEQSLGCAWWSGAMAPLEHELLVARFLTAPTRPGTREHCTNR